MKRTRLIDVLRQFRLVQAARAPRRRRGPTATVTVQTLEVRQLLTVNTAPTISLANTVTSLPENTDTTKPIKVADIVITDDGNGTNNLTLTGADAGYFHVVGTELYLRAGAQLNFEKNPELDVNVEVDDVTVGDTPDDTAFLSIAVTDVPETPPAIKGFDTAVKYTEGKPPVVLDTNATIGNTTSPNFDTGNLTVSITANVESTDLLGIRNQGTGAGQIGTSAGHVLYGGIDIGIYAGGDGINPLIIAFNDAATPAAAQALLRNLTYVSTSDNPGTATRTVQVTLVDDQGNVSLPVSKSISVTRVNTPPVIAGFSGTTAYTEGDSPAPVAPAATVADDDSPNFASGKLTVAISANASKDDRLTINNQGTDAGQVGVSGKNVTYGGTVIGTFTGGSGSKALAVTFNASATATAVTAVLQNVAFANISANPSTALRTLKATMTDGDGGTSAPVFQSVSVTAVNSNPALGGFNSTVTYTSNGPAVLAAPSATVADPDSLDFAGGALTVQLTTNSESTDVLSIRNQGTAKGMIGFDGTTVTFGGKAIGTASGGTAGDPLVITLNANADAAAAEALLRNITFASTSPAPSTLPRTLVVSITDGDGGSTDSDPQTIAVA